MACLKNQFIPHQARVGPGMPAKFWYYGSFFFSYFIFSAFGILGILLIDSAIKSPILIDNGAVQVANVGEITPYYFVAGQMLLTLAISMLFLVQRRGYGQNGHSTMAILMLTSLVVGVGMMLFFMLFSWLYQWYLASGDYTIMHIVRLAGNRFLFSFAPIIVLDAFSVVFLSFYLKYHGPWAVIIVSFLKTLFSLVFSYCLACLTSLNIYGFVVGFLIANVPFLVGSFIYFQRHSNGSWRIGVSDWKLLMRDLMMYALKDMWPQILKAVVVIIIAFTLFRHISPTLSGFYYSRVNWYMFIYLLPFLTTPAHLSFQVIKNVNPQRYNFLAHPEDRHFFVATSYTLFVATILVMVGFYFAMEPLSAFYVQNLPTSLKVTEANTGPGIASFLVLPGSLSYIFVALYVFLMAYGFYFGDKMQFIIPKGTGKITLKGLIGSLIGSLVVVAFIVGLGMGLMNKCWAFSYMSSYSFAMVVTAAIICLLSATFYFLTKAKVKKAMKQKMVPPMTEKQGVVATTK